MSNFLSPWKRKESFDRHPYPLAHYAVDIIKKWDWWTLCSISHSSMNAQPDFLQSWLKKKVVLSANCSRLSLHLQGNCNLGTILYFRGLELQWYWTLICFILTAWNGIKLCREHNIMPLILLIFIALQRRELPNEILLCVNQKRC